MRRAYASPTMVIIVTRSRAAVSRIVAMSNGLESSCSTTVPPWFSAINAVHCAATCMSGDVGNHTPPPAAARSQAIEVERLSDDPPERIAAWLASVGEASVRELDMLLTLDLMRVETDDTGSGSEIEPPSEGGCAVGGNLGFALVALLAGLRRRRR